MKAQTKLTQYRSMYGPLLHRNLNIGPPEFEEGNDAPSIAKNCHK
jgi:hypothetical protein